MINLFSQTSDSLNKKETLSSGIFTYKITGDYENGIETLIFKEEKIYVHRKIQNSYIKSMEYMYPPEETIFIQNRNEIFFFDITQRKGIKINNVFVAKGSDDHKVSMQYKNDLFSLIIHQLKPIINNNNLFSEEKNVVYFGKNCRVLKSSFFVLYLWNDYILRKEIFKPYSLKKEITSMEINIKISDTKFYPPSYITPKELSAKEMDELANDMKSFKIENNFSSDFLNFFVQKSMDKKQ